ncbi:hypothetical protein, partial [Stenotrophomonas sp. CASM114]|uniref:hypothetical protein n=1 Tax=Stenotrophomonas sp. CASM114 TaxID=3111512 RepID=UPI003BF8809D
DAKFTLGKDTKITNIVLPEGKKIEDVITNYEEVKGNVEKIETPDGKPVVPETPPVVTPPSSGGGGGGSTTPGDVKTGVQLLNEKIQTQIGKVTSNGIVVSMSNNIFTVVIDEGVSKFGEFNVAAEKVFDAFKGDTIVNSVAVSLSIDGQEVT